MNSKRRILLVVVSIIFTSIYTVGTASATRLNAKTDRFVEFTRSLIAVEPLTYPTIGKLLGQLSVNRSTPIVKVQQNQRVLTASDASRGFDFGDGIVVKRILLREVESRGTVTIRLGLLKHPCTRMGDIRRLFGSSWTYYPVPDDPPMADYVGRKYGATYRWTVVTQNNTSSASWCVGELLIIRTDDSGPKA